MPGSYSSTPISAAETRGTIGCIYEADKIMGKIVLGLAAPHNPNITARPDSMSDDEKERVLGAFDHLRKSIEETSPDCLLILTTAHMTNFFYHNNPLFCLGIGDTCEGPAPKELPRLGVRRA